MNTLLAQNQPAFPCPHGFSGTDRTTGMSLRDYFAAHAPRRMWAQFEPYMPTRPEPDWTGIPEEAQFDASPNNWQEIEAWKKEQKRQYERQWPWFYADAMLRERGRIDDQHRPAFEPDGGVRRLMYLIRASADPDAEALIRTALEAARQSVTQAEVRS